jgi:hypothetical protein
VRKQTRSTRLFELAKREAEVQFRELIHEAKLLVGLFPHLRDSYDSDELPLNFIMQREAGLLTKKADRKRRGTSGAAPPRRSARR